MSPLKKAALASSPIRASSDRRLASRASKGDRQAIATIFERYQQELYGFCLGLLGEPQDAQDALQNTMVKVLRALPGEEREIALKPWLYRIAHNEAIELRRGRHPTQILDGHLVDGRASVTEQAEQREQLEWLLNDLGDLPERQRTVLVMRELSGLDFAEIGAALDTSGAVVRQSLYEARRNLEQMDDGRGLQCDVVTRVLSGADGRVTRRRDIRAHLRDCPDCQRFRDAIGRREGVLATIPPVSLPVGAAAGAVQGLFGGAGGGGALAAVTAGAAKSAGAYGALKVAGTLAAVAVIGTAVQGEMKSPPPDPPPRQAFLRAGEGPSQGRGGVVRSVDATGPAHRFALTANEAPPILARAEISRRRSRSLPAEGVRPSSGVAARTPSPQQKTSPIAPPPAPPSTPVEATGRPSGPETSSPSVGGEKKGGDTSDTGLSPQSESSAASPKVPPGQAKKQAKAEAQPPPPTPPPETVTAEDGAEATPPVEGPNPKAKPKVTKSNRDPRRDRD